MQRSFVVSLLNKYQKEIKTQLMEEFNIKNVHALPQISKVVINAGAAEALSDKGTLEKIKDQIATISGQQPKITLAKKSISSFKLRAKDPIGVMVTLRSKKAWDFLEKFTTIVTPRIRDFRGLPISKFDRFGNYSYGITEQIIFPEIEYSKIDKIRGLVLTVVIKKSTPEKSRRLLELIGFKFRES